MPGQEVTSGNLHEQGSNSNALPTFEYPPHETSTVDAHTLNITDRVSAAIHASKNPDTCQSWINNLLDRTKTPISPADFNENFLNEIQKLVKDCKKILKKSSADFNTISLTHSLKNIFQVIILEIELELEARKDPEHEHSAPSIQAINQAFQKIQTILTKSPNSWEEMFEILNAISFTNISIVKGDDLLEACPLSPKNLLEVIMNADFNAHAANATHLELEFEIINNRMRITLRDNGKGFDFYQTPRPALRAGYILGEGQEKQRHSGKGLKIIMHYCEKACGSIERIENVEAPQTGAEITLSLPLNSFQTHWHFDTDQSLQDEVAQA